MGALTSKNRISVITTNNEERVSDSKQHNDKNYSKNKRNKKSNKNSAVTIIVIGIDNAGKTTAIAAMKGKSTDHIAPTVGFSFDNIKCGNDSLKFYDLGGGEKIRGIWDRYLAECYGAVFVVDSADTSRMSVAHDALFKVAKDDRFSGKPVLLLGNKQDVDNALDEAGIRDALDIASLEAVGPVKVQVCQAKSSSGDAVDSRIKEGLNWLAEVTRNESLTDRIARQLEEQNILLASEREAKKERIRKAREERLAEEAKLSRTSPADVVDVESITSETEDIVEQKKEEIVMESLPGAAFNDYNELSEATQIHAKSNKTVDMETVTYSETSTTSRNKNTKGCFGGFKLFHWHDKEQANACEERDFNKNICLTNNTVGHQISDISSLVTIEA